MNREEAKTKVMTIYGSLSEDMKQAIDVLVDAPNCERGKAEGINIPEGATNGDVIKIMFEVAGYTPIRNGLTDKDGYYVHIKGYSTHEVNFVVSLDWWNAPYKQEGKE